MKQSNESHGVVRQNDKTVQKSQKHDANLRKNSTLYFQIGLIMCLLASYTALEMSFATPSDGIVMAPTDEADNIYYPEDKNYIVEEEPKPKEEVVVKKKKIIHKIEITEKEDIEEAEKDLDLTVEPETVSKDPVLSEDDDILDVQPIDDPVNIMAVQKVPIYPGCEKAKNNNERRKCMSDKLKKLISKKFDSDLGAELGLSGKQKIYVSFKINKTGNVEILKTKGTHIRLEKEARRVVEKVPTMQPGKNNDEPVEVLYNLPITLNVQNY